MRNFWGFLAVVMIGFVACQGQPSKMPQPHEIITGKVSYVIDGRTFYFTSDYGKAKSRLYNIDTPELKDKNGFAYYEFLRELAHQKSANIEYMGTDSEGRWMVNANLTTGENLRDKILEHFPPLKK